MDNLLDKISETLKDQRVIVNRNDKWKNGLKTSKYSSSYSDYYFDIAPKNGFMKIDDYSIGKLRIFQNEVFKDLLTEAHKIRDISLKDCLGFNDYGIHPFSYPGLDRATENRILFLGHISAIEPIGIVERFSSFENKISPRYEAEFEQKDLNEKCSRRYKHVLTRQIHVYIFPSIEFLIELRNFRKRKDEFIKSKGINNVTSDEFEKFRQEEIDLGFIDIYQVSVNHYNQFGDFPTALL